MGNAYLKQAQACMTAQPGPPPKRRGQKLDGSGSGSGLESHSLMRSRMGEDSNEGPGMLEFILIPWLCSVLIVAIAILSFGCSWAWVFLPALLVCGVSGQLAYQKYRQSLPDNAGLLSTSSGANQSLAIFYLLCLVSGFAAFIVTLIAFVHFLQPYHELSGGATYLDVLPSQSAMAASDATAIVFAKGTSVDQSRTFGYLDGRHSDGTMYCVAPVSNQWTKMEHGVQFFAAGTNCCGKRSGFGCGSGTGRGALVLAREDNADQGFKDAVEGAAAAYGLRPGNGYLLLTMVADPMAYRQDKLDNAVKLLLIFVFVYFLISCMVGYMAHNAAKR